MRIRSVEVKDIPTLRDIYYQSRIKHFLWTDRTQFNIEDFDSATNGEAIWVAENKEKQIRGFISVWMPEHFIHNLFVAPETMGQGYGSALLQHCLARIGRPARLKCSKENHVAITFYHSHQWGIVGEGIGVEGPYYELEFNEAI